MQTFDPLVSLEGSMPGPASASATGLTGWLVAAEIIDRLREFGLLTSIDVAAIVGPALSDLTESELDELSRLLDGPLTDTPRGILQRYLKSRQQVT